MFGWERILAGPDVSPEPTKILSLPFWEILKIGKERSLDKIPKLPLLLCVNITCWFFFFFFLNTFFKTNSGFGVFFLWWFFFFNLFIKWWLSKWYILLFLNIVRHILEWLYWVRNQIRPCTKVFFFFFFREFQFMTSALLIIKSLSSKERMP